jgi:hypothetical protein
MACNILEMLAWIFLRLSAEGGQAGQVFDGGSLATPVVGTLYRSGFGRVNVLTRSLQEIANHESRSNCESAPDLRVSEGHWFPALL